ncbi:MAG: hypothetical protein ACRYGB_00375 [Janthinobacterium lividum]
MITNLAVETAESLRGQQIIVKLTDGEEWHGLLNCVKIDTKTYEVLLELLDTNSKGLMIPLKSISSIKPA